jgi:hypothetical protein
MKTKDYSPRTHGMFVAAILSLSAMAALIGTSPARACGDYLSEPALKKLAYLAVSENASDASQAAAALRARGPEGLAAFLAVHAEAMQRQLSAMALSPNPSNSANADWQRLNKALDSISGQRDCSASRLYWHTDFERAKASARSSGKPILSLRLLGRLDEELSCANSRFFRTALYANAEVSQVLRDRFILHWQSVRPVPKITIDFGDGRKLERTVTGNSIHYVLDADGRPIDALPGLYGPKAFLRGLTRAENADRQFRSLAPEQREEFLRIYHQARLAAITEEWNNDLVKIGGSLAISTTNSSVAGTANKAPTAQAAARITRGKRQLELPLLESVAPRSSMDSKALEGRMDDATWATIAVLHAEDARLDQGSRMLMAKKNPDAFAAGRRALTKMAVEDPLVRAARQFERSMAEDTVRNEYLFHAKIHDWFAQALAPTKDVGALNEKVYAELFLTPSSDPWLGLKPNDAYSGLDKDGIVRQTSF